MLAVNVTVCPDAEGFMLDASDVDVPALFTICASPGEVLPVKPPPPE